MSQRSFHTSYGLNVKTKPNNNNIEQKINDFCWVLPPHIDRWNYSEMKVKFKKSSEKFVGECFIY